MKKTQEYDLHWNFVTGWIEVENAFHVRFNSEKIDAIQDILGNVAYYCHLLNEKKRAYPRK